MPQTDDFSVAFHIGAHKTATSHLQRSLSVGADALAAAGVQYYGPPHFRLPGRSLPALFGLRSARRAAGPQRRSPQDQLTLLRKGASRLVLSEENYIGPLNNPRPEMMQVRYPDAGARITALAQAMDAGGVDVLMSTRQPATFLNSAYGQMLLGGQFMSIEQYKNLNPLSSVNWYDVVRQIRQAEGVNNLTVWRYEDYPQVFDQITTALVGDGAAGIVQPLGRRVHAGLSAAAVEEALRRNVAGEKGRFAFEVRHELPVEKGHAPFEGFTPAEHTRAGALYDKQIAAIAACPGVTFLQP